MNIDSFLELSMGNIFSPVRINTLVLIDSLPINDLITGAGSPNLGRALNNEEFHQLGGQRVVQNVEKQKWLWSMFKTKQKTLHPTQVKCKL